MPITLLNESGSARQRGTAGPLVDLAVSRKTEAGMGIAAEPMRQGRAGHHLRAARALTAVGGLVGRPPPGGVERLRRSAEPA